MKIPTRSMQRWKSAMQRAGYSRANGVDTFHFSQLAHPGGDRAAAVRAYRQLLLECPESRKALEGLAFLLQLQGRRSEALPYRRELLRLHAQDLGVSRKAQGDVADYLLSAESGGVPPAQTPQVYIEGLFDQYAGKFDRHLVNQLRYRGPGLLFQQFAEHRPEGRSALDILDIGCGTGLAGVAFKPLARRLDGIDLSQKMLDIASARGIYDRLDRGEILAFLRQCSSRYDLIVAADVLAYFGDLQPLFVAAGSVLRDGGYFVFTVEKGDHPGYRLRSTGRYQHSEDYVRDCAQRARLDVVASAEEVLREQLGQPVIACVMLLRRAD